MVLHEILRAKGNALHTISKSATLNEVASRLCTLRCGSLVVVEYDRTPHGRLIGIVTERDLLRSYCNFGADFGQHLVSEVMSTDVIIGSPADSLDDVMGVMTDNRIRHLPVMADGELIGIVSIGDIVKAQHDALSMENHYLKSYIHG